MPFKYSVNYQNFLNAHFNVHIKADDKTERLVDQTLIKRY
jgi:hypothetical protein